MIPKSGNRFSEKIMLNNTTRRGQKPRRIARLSQAQVIVDSRFGMSDDDPRPGFGKIIPTRSR